MTDITQPPPGYITIQDINRSLVGQLVNLIGIVVNVREPTKSRGADWMLTLRICDRTRALAGTSFTVRYFKAQPALPHVHNPGDILIIRKLKISTFNENLIGLNCFETQTVTIYSAPVPASTHTFAVGSFRASVNPVSRCPPPNEAEYNFASSLSTFWKARGGDAAALGVSKAVYENELVPAYERRRKFSLVKDLHYGNYYDLAGEVVKTFGAGGDWFTVYLTDYTKHPQLYNYDWTKVYASTHTDDYDYTGRGDGFRPPGSGAERNWPGPLGRYTIQVTLWDSHAVAARNMELEGQVVMLRNVKIRKNKDDNMEGWMNGDKKYPDKVGIEVCKDAGLRREVRVRKEVYARAFERQRVEYEAALEEKRKEGEEKRRAEMEKREARRKEANQNVVMDQARIGDSDEALPTTSFAEILHIAKAENRPFVNHKYRIYARVVDFLPHELEDFAVKVEPRAKRQKVESSGKESQSLATQAQLGVLPEDMVDSEEEEEEEEDESAGGRWQWRFGLVLEDKEGTALPVVVDNYAGQMLLGLDACELRKHPQQLAKLREQLFVLWGTVEEHKRGKLHALALQIEKKKMLKRKKPGDGEVEGGLEEVERKMEEIQGGFEAGRWFEGAVQEYGAVSEGGRTKRRWGLVSTRIKA